MKTVKDKYVLMAADFAGVYIKDAVKAHLENLGWHVEDIGAQATDTEPEMFHHIGLKVGAKIAEREYERALLFCGTGMGIHIAASKCPHVHAACVESVHAALRAITGNNVNVMAMGGHYVGPGLAIEIADAFLYHNLGDGYEWWPGWYDFHKYAYDELENFDYETFKKNGFTFPDSVEIQLPGNEIPEECLKNK